MLANAVLLAGNALLWVFVFLYLKKKLSPRGIVAEARKAIDELLLKLNSDSDRNIRLLQHQIEQVREVSLEARQLCDRVEERLALLYGELEKASSVKDAEERLYPALQRQEKRGGRSFSELTAPFPHKAPPEPAAPAAAVLPPESPAVLQRQEAVADAPQRQNAVPQPEAAVSEPGSFPEAKIPAGPAPGVFPQDDTLNKSLSPLDSYMKEQLRFSAGEAGGIPAAGEEAPAPQEMTSSREPSRTPSVPEFFQAEKPIAIPKSFHQQVMEMKQLGYSIEEIAHETGRSTQEVKITIEISPE